MSSGGDAYRYHAAHGLLVSVALQASWRIVEASPENPCLAVRILLEPAVVGELLADGATAPDVGTPQRGLVLTPADPLLLDAVHRLVRLLDSPQDIVALAPLVLREITYRLLISPHGSRLRQVALAGAPAQRVARSIRWLRDHLAEPILIESLAKRVGMRPSTFHLHFKGLTALSPLQYQKRLRLHEARRLMLGEGVDAADAAFRVGYESPSQYAREYRRLFGAPPRHDVTVLKRRAALAMPRTSAPAPL